MKKLFLRLNGEWHQIAMQFFMLIIISHFLEHVFQVYQLYVLQWARPKCLGALGLIYPWLVHSEYLHYGHALFMLVGLAVLRPAITSKAKLWWDIALVLGFLHHLEHALLLSQVIIHQNLFNSPVPISIGQIWFPRLELHFFYNAIVLTPMLISLYYHRSVNQMRSL